jgi:16S rRNA (cytosine967-C5)-methyltransferase
VSGSADGARALALRVIRRVTEEGAYSNLTLASALGRSRLTRRDRRLASELAYGTLRRVPALDWALARHASRPLDRVTPSALALLRLGAYQLLFTRIPDHAAIGETVALASPGERGFVNAVLRSLARDPPAWPAGSDDDAVSIRTGVAPWAVRELRRLLGDEAEAAAAALGERAPLTIRTNTCRASTDELESALRDSGHRPRRGGVHPEALLLDETTPRELPGYAEGWFAIQDQASSLVVRALDPRPGERVLDACAGPGGKAGHVACRVAPQGAAVGADVSPSRAGLVAAQARRLGVRVYVVVQDARKPALRGPFDRVLVDAPCSGIGAARRRPELLWRVRRHDLSRLARLQVTIVASCADLLRPGGRLVYSVCTFPRAETDAACDAILRHRPDLHPIAVSGPGGDADRVRLWPHRHGTDAMFVAAFERP